MGDFIGPVIPEHLKAKSGELESDSESESDVIGPALPPGWKKDEDVSRDINADSESYKNIGSNLPPNLTKKRSLDYDEDNEVKSVDKSSNSKRLENPKDTKKVIGPTLPPGLSDKSDREKEGTSYMRSNLLSESTSNQLQTYDETSSDEDDEFTIGPLPPSGNFIEVEESRHQKSIQAPAGLKGPQREEWIASLPENSSVAHKLGFGKSMSSFSSKPVSIKEIVPVDHDNALDETVAEYNKAARPEALVDIHKKKIKDKKKEEVPSRSLFDFNPEEDMKVRQLDSQQTKSIMEKAKLLNSRFANPRGQNKFL